MEGDASKISLARRQWVCRRLDAGDNAEAEKIGIF